MGGGSSLDRKPEGAAPTEARISRMGTRKVITRVDLKRMVTGNACVWRDKMWSKGEEQESSRGKLSLSENEMVRVSTRMVSQDFIAMCMNLGDCCENRYIIIITSAYQMALGYWTSNCFPKLPTNPLGVTIFTLTGEALGVSCIVRKLHTLRHQADNRTSRTALDLPCTFGSCTLPSHLLGFPFSLE
jgi:hypothetical protein